MTHNLVLGYGLYQKMQIYVCFLHPPFPNTPENMQQQSHKNGK